MGHLRSPLYSPAFVKEHEPQNSIELFDDPTELDSNFVTTDEPEEKIHYQEFYDKPDTTTQTVCEPSISKSPPTLQPDWVTFPDSKNKTYSLAMLHSMFLR